MGNDCCWIVSGPRALRPRTRDKEVATPVRFLELDESLYRYVLDHSLREHPAQAALREVTAGHPMAGMQIAPEQGQLMAMLVKLMGARRTIEVGVFTGDSALAVALALPDDGHLLACDISDEYTRVGRPFWDRQRQHPLPHWHMGDDVVHQVCRRLRHPPRAA